MMRRTGLRTVPGLAFAMIGLLVLGVGFSELAFANGNSCKSGTTDETRPTALPGPWKAPSKATDPTPLNCNGHCTPMPNCTWVCKEIAVSTANQYGTPPPGASEFSCACVYTCDVNGVTVTMTVVSDTCDKHVMKDDDGNPIPWNGDPANDDFHCAGPCSPGTCEVEPRDYTQDENGVYHRDAKCICK